MSLLTVNPKRRCSTCGGGRRQRAGCDACKQTGYQPIDLEGFWAPSAAFLVGGGPSLNLIPMERLRDRGVMSLGINNAAGYAPVAASVFSDPQYKFHHGIHLDGKILSFVPTPKLKRCVRVKLPNGTFRDTTRKVGDCPGVIGFSRRTTWNPNTFFDDWYAQWGPGGKAGNDRPFTKLCTMMLGLRILVHLGCPRIYLLGVDFWRPSKGQGYAFAEKGSGGVCAYQKEERMLLEIQPGLESRGIQIFNAGPKTNSEAFPRVAFGLALADCRGHVPTEPFDLSDWYSHGLASRMREEYPQKLRLD